MKNNIVPCVCSKFCNNLEWDANKHILQNKIFKFIPHQDNTSWSSNCRGYMWCHINLLHCGILLTPMLAMEKQFFGWGSYLLWNCCPHTIANDENSKKTINHHHCVLLIKPPIENIFLPLLITLDQPCIAVALSQETRDGISLLVPSSCTTCHFVYMLLRLS